MKNLDNKKFEAGKNPMMYLSAITVYYVYQQCFKKSGLIINGNFDDDKWAGNLLRKRDEPFPENEKIKSASNEKYVRDRYSEVCDDINGDKPYKIKGYGTVKFDPLLEFAGIDNYEQINQSFIDRNLLPKFCVEDVTGAWVKPEKIEKFLCEPEIADSIDKKEPEEETGQSLITVVLPEVIEPTAIPVVYCVKPFKDAGFLPRIPDDEGYLYFYENGVCEFNGERVILIKKEDLKFAGLIRMPRDKKKLWVRVDYVVDQKVTEAYFAEQAPGTGENILVLEFPAQIHDCFIRMLNSMGLVS